MALRHCYAIVLYPSVTKSKKNEGILINENKNTFTCAIKLKKETEDDKRKTRKEETSNYRVTKILAKIALILLPCTFTLHSAYLHISFLTLTLFYFILHYLPSTCVWS